MSSILKNLTFFKKRELIVGPILSVNKTLDVNLQNVEIDPNSPFGLKGLPKDYEALLGVAGISKQDAMENKDEVLGVLKFHMEGPPKMKTNKEARKDLKDAVDLKKQDPKKFYSFGKPLGKGAGGVVYECTKMSDGQVVAIKEALMQDFDDIRNEIAVQALSRHKNVINFLETYVTQHHVYIVMEHMDGGSLTNIIGKKVRWNESNIAYVLKECLLALENLHAHHRLHRDVKSDNVLFSFNGQIKMADFGYAATLTEEQGNRTSIVGTPYWMAPELIKSKPYNQKVDVWSLGITALEVADGVPPFFGEQMNDVRSLMKIVRAPAPKPSQPEQWSDFFNHYLKQSLRRRPEKRSSTTELLLHPFIGNAGDSQNFARFAISLRKPAAAPKLPF